MENAAWQGSSRTDSKGLSTFLHLRNGLHAAGYLNVANGLLAPLP